MALPNNKAAEQARAAGRNLNVQPHCIISICRLANVAMLYSLEVRQYITCLPILSAATPATGENTICGGGMQRNLSFPMHGFLTILILPQSSVVNVLCQNQRTKLLEGNENDWRVVNSLSQSVAGYYNAVHGQSSVRVQLRQTIIQYENYCRKKFEKPSRLTRPK